MTERTTIHQLCVGHLAHTKDIRLESAKCRYKKMPNYKRKELQEHVRRLYKG